MEQKIITIPRILCLFDYACNTGFATASTAIIRDLHKHFGPSLEFDIFAINYFGELYDENPQVRVCSAQLNDLPADNEKGLEPDIFGRIGFAKQLANSDYTGIFIIQDPTILTGDNKGGIYTKLLQEIKDKKRKANQIDFKSIFYFPVDCDLVKVNTEGLDFFDAIVTYTEFGKKAVIKHNKKLLPKIKVIPHGNNPKDFYPIFDKKEITKFRKEFFGEQVPGSRFIIINVNRNQPRKDLPNTIFGFIEAKENWPKNLPKPFLYLHTNPDDPKGWDLRLLMEQTDLVEGVDYKFTPDDIKQEQADKELLNKIYNAADVYLTTTTGEGWGLTVTEAMATKTPVICTNYSSLPEMTNYGKRAWLLETLYPCCSNTGSMIRRQTDPYEVADKLLEVAIAAHGEDENTDEFGIYQEKIEAAYQYVQSMDWEIVNQKWCELFSQVFKIK